MPSDSVAAFLDRAQASRVLHPDQVEQIVRQPNLSELALPELCEYLEKHRILTRYQAERIREGRWEELHFAGYPIQELLGPCPGGTAYRSLHPSLKTPVVLRRLRTEWLAPADNVPAYLQRARAASTLHHPHLVSLLDAGVERDEPYAVLEAPGDAASLDALVADIGPMPGVLAVDFVRQAASSLQLAHERGGFHGDVRPANMLVGPLADSPKPGPDGKPRRRPTPASLIRLAELGLVPIRPPASQFAPDLPALPYLPPERIDAQAYGPPSDLYGLGCTLFFLLTGRPPFPGSTTDEILHRVRTAEPPPLESLRPDLPPELIAAVKQLLSKNPAARFASVPEVEARLAPLGRPGGLPIAAGGPLPTAVTVAVASSVFPSASPAAIPQPQPGAEHADSFIGAEEWAPAVGGSFAGGHSGGFSTSALADTGPRKRVITEADKRRSRIWLVLGIGLHSTAVLLLVGAVWFGIFDSKPSAEPEPTATHKKKDVIRHKKPKKPPTDENS